MPECRESEHNQGVEEVAVLAPKRDVDVANEPAVEASVPRPPESLQVVVVAHAAVHVLHRFDAVQQGPKPEEPPDGEELEPDHVQGEIPKHSNVKWGEVGVRPRGGECVTVQVMRGHLHDPQGKQKAEEVKPQKLGGKVGGWGGDLRGEGIEGHGGSCDVEGHVEEVGKVKGQVVCSQGEGILHPLLQKPLRVRFIHRLRAISVGWVLFCLDGPVEVHIEGDHAKDNHVEANVPAH